MEIWDSQMEAARRALDSANLSPQSIRRHRNHQPAGDRGRVGSGEREAGL